MRKTVISMVLLPVLLTAALVGCGDDDDAESTDTTESDDGTTTAPDDDTTTTAESSAGPPTLEGTVNDEGTEDLSGSAEAELTLSVQDFAFGPTFVQADQGATVTVALSNDGDAPHTFTIDELDIDEDLAPGATAEVEVALPDGDPLRFYCRLHESSGMQGAFFS